MAIIGISGYAGSGKDSLGKAIQWVMLPDVYKKLIHIPSFIDGGYDYIAYANKSGWQVKKFADPLKEVCSVILNVERRDFENPEFKSKVLDSKWGEEMTARKFLQVFGTDVCRKTFNENIWVYALFNKYVCLPNYPNTYPDWIITDCRFPNEAEEIKKRGGLIVRINRPEVSALNAHISELALDDYEFDYVINNNGTEEDLIMKAEEMIKHLCI